MYLYVLLITVPVLSDFLPNTLTVPYCAVTSSTFLNTRQIPPLSNTDAAKVSTLKQVQVITRHGARTTSAIEKCWENYNVPWNNCNVTELSGPSNSYTSNKVSPSIFRKLFNGSPNILGGNCETAQLISEGYEQQKMLGRILRDTYIGNSRFNLFTTNQWGIEAHDKNVYLRSDNIERTLLSGQVF